MKKLLSAVFLTALFVVGCGKSGETLTPITSTEKLTLITWGAEWCGECHQKLPTLNAKLLEDSATKNRTVRKVYVTSGKESGIEATQAIADEYKANLNLDFEASPDAYGVQCKKLLGVKKCELPAAILLRANGTVYKKYQAGAGSFDVDKVFLDIKNALK